MLLFMWYPYIASGQGEVTPVVVVDIDVAELENLAEQGDKEAQFRLGLFYETQRQEFDKSAYWYDLAANQDHPIAQYNLGVLYMMGKGVKKSSASALQLWLKSAKQDHAHAQFNVARGYLLGIGVSEDQDQAMYWLQRAAKQGEPKSIELLASLDKRGQKVKATSSSSNGDIINQPSDMAEEKISLYAAPNKTSEVLTDVANKGDLTLFLEKQGDWLRVKSKQGFPVWVHQNYATQDPDSGFITIKGDNVRARSRPTTINSTIIDEFLNGDQVKLINQTQEWYQVESPSRFSAWIKESDWQ